MVQYGRYGRERMHCFGRIIPGNLQEASELQDQAGFPGGFDASGHRPYIPDPIDEELENLDRTVDWIPDDYEWMDEDERQASMQYR